MLKESSYCVSGCGGMSYKIELNLLVIIDTNTQKKKKSFYGRRTLEVETTTFGTVEPHLHRRPTKKSTERTTFPLHRGTANEPELPGQTLARRKQFAYLW